VGWARREAEQCICSENGTCENAANLPGPSVPVPAMAPSQDGTVRYAFGWNPDADNVWLWVSRGLAASGARSPLGMGAVWLEPWLAADWLAVQLSGELALFAALRRVTRAR
jgi:hypothetical protein